MGHEAAGRVPFGFSRHKLRCPRGEMGPRPPAWAGAALGSALGAPSAELSLVGLRPRRARLRFTRRQQRNQTANEEQEQGRCLVQVDQAR